MARNQRVIQTSIGRLNQTVNAQDGEIQSMKNISVTEYPVIASRPDRYAKAFPGSDETGFKATMLGTDGSSLFWIAETLRDAKRHFALWFYGAKGAAYETDATLAPCDYAVMGKTILFTGTQHLLFNTATGEATAVNPSDDVGGIPYMDYVCSVNNRMWGCTRSGQIYASKLGDATSWKAYDGLSTDSWSLDMSVSVNEPFTGCAVLNSRPVFFTETKCVTVYGDYPTTFSTYTNEIYGVMDGCHRSIAEVNGYLYYLSRWGFVRYNSGGSAVISSDIACAPIRIGDTSNTLPPCHAGTDGRVYHACVHTGGYEAYGDQPTYINYVYDTFTGLWAVEDEKPFSFYCRQGRDLYALGTGILPAELGYGDEERQLIYYIRGDMPTDTLMADMMYPVDDIADTEHVITFAPIYETDEEGTARKWLKFIRLRMILEPSSIVKVSVFYDNSQTTDTEFTYVAGGGRYAGGRTLIEVPCANTNCDSYRISIRVNTAFKLMAVSREYEIMR